MESAAQATAAEERSERPEVTTLKREALEALDADKLREMAKEAGYQGSHLAFAKKTTLINLLLGNTVGSRRKEGGGNGSGNIRKDELADILAAALTGRVKAGMDEGEIRRIVREEYEVLGGGQIDEEKVTGIVYEVLRKHKKVIEIKDVKGERREVGVQHKEFENILKLVSMRMDVFLVGPAGSGKTTCCESVAKALDLPFFVQPVGLQTTKSDLLGFMNANGIYVPSLLRKAYENGGVYLMDEIDAGNANVLTVINAMMSNGVAGFPDQMVARHPDFVFIAAGNTYGKGSDRQYVGRNPIDAATLDRFVIIDFEYDEAFEKALGCDDEWTAKIQVIRTIVSDLKERVIVSPRATIKGGILRKAGYKDDALLEMLVFRGVNHEVKQRILNHLERS